MSRKDNNISLAFGIPGIIAQVGGYIIAEDDKLVLVGLTIMLLGVILFCMGLAFYAKAKGHSPAFGICGLFGLIGLIVLVCLPDDHKRKQMRQSSRRYHRQQTDAGAALAELDRH